MKSNILTEKILIVDSNIDYAKFIQNALKKERIFMLYCRIL